MNKKVKILLLVILFFGGFNLLSIFKPSVLSIFSKNSDPYIAWEYKPIISRYLSKFREDLYENECTRIGGKLYKLHGIMGVRRLISCHLPYEDKGKICNYTNECKGFCKYTGSIPESCGGMFMGDRCVFEEDITGVCSDYPTYLFQSWYEVEGNTVISDAYPVIF